MVSVTSLLLCILDKISLSWMRHYNQKFHIEHNLLDI
jgi:hypothetical protein